MDPLLPPTQRPRALLWSALTTAAIALMAGLLSGPAYAAPLAGPSSAPERSACEASATESRRTADIPLKVSGRVLLGGCVVDNVGIERIVVDWKADGRDGSRGRVCTDPVVGSDGAWRCEWDTALLEAGAYTVEFVAIDLAGNRGSFERRYEVHEPDAAPRPAPPAGPQPEAEPGRASPLAPGGGEPADPPLLPDVDEPAVSIQPPPSPPAETEGAPAPTDPEQPTAPPGLDASPASTPERLTHALAIARIEACARNEVDALPTASADVVSQVGQAEAVRACLAPALEALGAAVVELDVVPVPPAVRAIFADPAVRDELAATMPRSVAGVTLELLTQSELAEPLREPAGPPVG